MWRFLLVGWSKCLKLICEFLSSLNYRTFFPAALPVDVGLIWKTSLESSKLLSMTLVYAHLIRAPKILFNLLTEHERFSENKAGFTVKHLFKLGRYGLSECHAIPEYYRNVICYMNTPPKKKDRKKYTLMEEDSSSSTTDTMDLSSLSVSPPPGRAPREQSPRRGAAAAAFAASVSARDVAEAGPSRVVTRSAASPRKPPQIRSADTKDDLAAMSDLDSPKMERRKVRIAGEEGRSDVPTPDYAKGRAKPSRSPKSRAEAESRLLAPPQPDIEMEKPQKSPKKSPIKSGFRKIMAALRPRERQPGAELVPPTPPFGQPESETESQQEVATAGPERETGVTQKTPEKKSPSRVRTRKDTEREQASTTSTDKPETTPKTPKKERKSTKRTQAHE